MSHHASPNWRNKRKNPEAGLHQPHEASRNHVRALLGGTEDEALGFIRRHSENESFLRIAEELEMARMPERGIVLRLIRQFRKTLAERSVA